MSDVLNNYDTAYSLLWGTDLAEGRAPDLEVDLAPTPHPLQNAVSYLLGLVGDTDFGMAVWNGLALVALGVLAVLLVLLGRRWFGLGAGFAAAAIVLTREPVLSFGLRAYLDLPYLCLLLGALLVEARRPRAGTPVLVLLLLAGLLRPEAWLFAAAYAGWLWRGGVLRPQHLVLAAAAPVLWAAHDLVLTGDPLWSLTGTRENADELGRVTGLQNVPLTAPRRIGEVLREPVLLGAALGVALAWRRRLWLPLAATAVALVAFALLATAGLPILTRYLLVPAAVLALLAAGAATAVRDGRAWAAGAAVVVVALAAFAPAQADRLQRLDRALDRQEAILADLREVVRSVPPDAVLTLPNRRGIPQVRLWTGRRPDAVRSAIDDGVRGVYVAPADPQVARDFVLDRRDRDQALPPVRDVQRRGRFWVVGR